MRASCVRVVCGFACAADLRDALGVVVHRVGQASANEVGSVVGAGVRAIGLVVASARVGPVE